MTIYDLISMNGIKLDYRPGHLELEILKFANFMRSNHPNDQEQEAKGTKLKI